VETIKTTFKYSLKTMHPFFNDKLYCGSDPVGQIAEFIVAVLNTGTHVYHVSPVFSVMEVECVKFFGKSFGYDPETVDGTFNPGGSMSNIMSTLCARHEHFPHVRMEGWRQQDRPIAFTPHQSHYSIARAAMLCGMGMN
jgi:glutamate/tyrosine decarboxylase-like PLP-dependent enzyme